MTEESWISDNYEFSAKVGSGAYGVVYRAKQESTGRDVAVKFYDLELVRGGREVEVHCKLPQHQNLVTVFDAGQTEDGPFGSGPYMIMEYLAGGNLWQRMERRSKPLRPKIILSISKQICRAVKLVHSNGIVHRDIKPQNILVDKKTGKIKLGDFGIARDLNTMLTATQTQSTPGSMGFMAPEVASGRTMGEEQSDLYSLGALFYWLWTGELPLGRFEEPRETRPNIPEAINDCIMQLLASTSEDRPQSADAILDVMRKGVPPEEKQTRKEGREPKEAPRKATLDKKNPCHEEVLSKQSHQKDTSGNDEMAAERIGIGGQKIAKAGVIDMTICTGTLLLLVAYGLPFLVAFICAVLPYFVFFEASTWAATPGKKAVGIRVLSAAGERLSVGQALLKNIYKPVALVLCAVDVFKGLSGKKAIRKYYTTIGVRPIDCSSSASSYIMAGIGVAVAFWFMLCLTVSIVAADQDSPVGPRPGPGPGRNKKIALTSAEKRVMQKLRQAMEEIMVAGIEQGSIGAIKNAEAVALRLSNEDLNEEVLRRKTKFVDICDALYDLDDEYGFVKSHGHYTNFRVGKKLGWFNIEPQEKHISRVYLDMYKWQYMYNMMVEDDVFPVHLVTIRVSSAVFSKRAQENCGAGGFFEGKPDPFLVLMAEDSRRFRVIAQLGEAKSETNNPAWETKAFRFFLPEGKAMLVLADDDNRDHDYSDMYIFKVPAEIDGQNGVTGEYGSTLNLNIMSK